MPARCCGRAINFVGFIPETKYNVLPDTLHRKIYYNNAIMKKLNILNMTYR
jgi:hypothetical protein